MENFSEIKRLLSIQESQQRNVPIDIILKNGNILIRSFQLFRLDMRRKMIEGFTRLESYSSVRENREPVVCRLKLSEISMFLCAELDLETA